MTAASLIADLAQAGITLHLKGAEVACRGNRTAMSPELAQRLKQNKDTIRSYLQQDVWSEALAAAESAIDQAEQDQRLADVKRRVLGHYRTVARKHHDNRNPTLIGWADEVKYEMQTIWGLKPVESSSSSGEPTWSRPFVKQSPPSKTPSASWTLT